MLELMTFGWCSMVAGLCLTIVAKRGRKFLTERRMSKNIRLAVGKIAEGRL